MNITSKGGDEVQLTLKGEKPLFLQFSEQLEDNILKGIFEEETQIPSTTEVAITFKINPATANRGVNLLVDEGIIYKKRGIGMFVNTGAREKIVAKRKNSFYESYILSLLKEAQNLNITKAEIIALIERGAQDEHD
ncbi:MAG TPA: GntR family transcriptional regulator [Desulfosporosinus sp.]|nr:GntR family transcriptional regulator [Desulfosporosinus sp.]